MPTNPFFDVAYNLGEQELLKDLILEATQIYGIEVYYIPRRRENFDIIYGADDMSIYDSAYLIEAYVESYSGFEGNQDIFTKFAGVEIRDQITLSIPARSFEKLVEPYELNATRPSESDLIYFTLNKKCFMIKFVDNKPVFYPLGTLPSYKITLELFEYSSERFNTGIPEIDILNNYSEDAFRFGLYDTSGNWLLDPTGLLVCNVTDQDNIDPEDDGEQLDQEADNWLDFSETNPFVEKGW